VKKKATKGGIPPLARFKNFKKRGRVNRYYVVVSPRSSTVHRALTITEGNRTMCGRRMSTTWKWGNKYRRAARAHKCKGCYT
jgi:hypothetical protein